MRQRRRVVLRRLPIADCPHDFALCRLSSAFCILPSAFCFLPSVALERLRKPEVHLCSLQTIDRRRAIEIVDAPRWATLWNQKLRRIEQVRVIDRQGAAERRLNSEAQANGIRPMCPQVRFVYSLQNKANLR